jgi:hypothetical protein
MHRRASQSVLKRRFKIRNHEFICRTATAGNARPARPSGVSKNDDRPLQLNIRRNTFAAGFPRRSQFETRH